MRISDWSSDVCSSDLSTRTRRAASRAIAAALIEHPPLVGLPAMPHGEVPSPPLTDEQLAVKRGQAELGDVYWSESGIATTLADAMIDQLRIAPALSDKEIGRAHV